MKKSIESNKAILQLERVYFDEIKYMFHANETTNFQYLFDFEKEIEEIDENKYKVTLVCHVCDENNEVDLLIRVIGEFICEIEDTEFKNTLLNENAIAILFPYLRSHICLVTAQPSIPPINLPAINVLSLFDER